MQARRLNYAYRLSIARLVILRLRLARCWKQFFSNRRFSRGLAAGRFLSVATIVIGMLGSGMLGYRIGEEQQAGLLVKQDQPATPVQGLIHRRIQTQSETSVQNSDRGQTPATDSELVINQQGVLKDHDALLDHRPVMQRSIENTETDIPGARESGLLVEALQVPRPADLMNLRETVSSLQAQVQALEEEASGLELELLDQQIAFARKEQQLKEASVEKRIVYNITNIPVGGSVSRERMQIDANSVVFAPPEENSVYQENTSVNGTDPFKRYREPDGAVEAWKGELYLSAVLDQQSMEQIEGEKFLPKGGSDETLESRKGAESPSESDRSFKDTRRQQEVFFGPAPDRYEELINP